MLKLYENIRRLRRERGMTQVDLAEAAGYNDRSMIAKIESGKVDLSRSKIETFANIFGVPASELMGWEEPPADPLDEQFLSLFNSLGEREKSLALAMLETLVKSKGNG